MGKRKMVDSGVEWIGMVPEEWDIGPIKSILRISATRTTGENLYVGMENIEAGTGKYISGEDARTSDFGVNSKFSKGEILFGKLRPYLRKVWLADRDGSCSTEFLVMSTNNIETNRFFSYVLISEEFCSLVNDSCKGVKMPRADWAGVSSIRSPIPPLEEQQAIADFLDHHISLIDRERDLISQKIDLLKEKKKSIIFECVTGKRTIVEAQALAGVDDWSDIVGVGEMVAIPTPKKDDPFVKEGKLVDSGVEWIGEIPGGWNTEKVGQLTSTTSGGTPKNSIKNYGGDVSWATTTDLNNGILYSTKTTITNDGLKESSAKIVPPRSILMAMYGASIGKIAITGKNMATNQSVIAILPVETTNYKFLFYGMVASKDYLIELGSGAGQPNISQEIVRNLRMPTPPPKEQQAIADFLDCNVSLIEREYGLLVQKIEMLNEKKKALIFEITTGKTSVNEFNK